VTNLSKIGKKPRKRDAAATRLRILDAARADFAAEGFTGARIDRIAKTSQTNVQMIYRYFGNKEDLYLASLTETFNDLRERQDKLDLSALPPVEGLRKLVEFTFDYMEDNPEFVAMIRNESVVGGKFVKGLPVAADSTRALIDTIGDLLRRGYDSGAFTAQIDPRHLYVTILSLCMEHQANGDTLSAMLDQDLAAPEWQSTQRRIAIDMSVSYLTAS